MHFAFSTATIASISGAALLAHSTPRKVDASTSFPKKPFNSSRGRFKSPVKTRGAECSLVDDKDAQQIHPDIGILQCGPGRTCVEDTTSSMGGRCTFKLDVEAIVSGEADGIACNFENGTAGVKCHGSNACDSIDGTQVGCGSCIGDLSCSFVQGNVTIGENSCIRSSSCFAIQGNVTIGENSCVGDSVCKYVSGNVLIGDNSCEGERSCYDADGISNPTNIGSDSCNGAAVCQYLKGTVGHGSCIDGKYACLAFNGGTIGSSSCSQFFACAQHSYRNNTGSIGNNSCNGPWTCNFMTASRNTGDNSCNGYRACADVTYDVGHNTCNGDYACPVQNCYPFVKKVKLQSVTGAPIQVFEVKVYSSGNNVAENKTASQSSTLKGNPKFGAIRAVDGIANTFSHTVASRECSPWWEVDLGGLFPIESVHILNRWCQDESDPTACLCRLSHASLALFDDQGRCVESISLGNTCGFLEVKHDFNKSSVYCPVVVLPPSEPN